MPRKVLIMGAAGRDFHNFNTFFRDNEAYQVVAFTATQIPDIEGRVYPKELAGSSTLTGSPSMPKRNSSPSSRITRSKRLSLPTPISPILS